MVISIVNVFAIIDAVIVRAVVLLDIAAASASSPTVASGRAPLRLGLLRT